MKYLHEESHIGVHGHLTSQCCLIDRRWILKVSGFGLQKLFKAMKAPSSQRHVTKKGNLLYYAPERLKSPEKDINPSSDVYSFAMIACEVIARKDIRKLFPKLSLEEILVGVSKNGMRPQVTQREADIPIEIMNLIGRCWSDRPEERLSFRSIASCLRRFPAKGCAVVYLVTVV